LIATAAERGVVDSTQRDALTALADEITGANRHDEPTSFATESGRPFNPVMIAYSAGALLVLFALGWFLADRWRDLGGVGVLVVSGVYTAAFAITSHQLRRRGFRVASGLVAALAVAMTPVWSWALLRIAGEWPPSSNYNDPLLRFEPWIASRWIILELATIAVALITLRRVRFFAIAIPIAAAFVGVLLHLGKALGDPEISYYVGPYYACVVGCLTLAIGYAIDRREGDGEDYAVWFYFAATLVLLVGYVGVWRTIGWWRHALPLVAAVFVIAALYLRRRVLLLAAGIAAFGYLGYLAFDVFENVIGLPIALAGLGLLVIASTVWVQRRVPVLVARMGGAHEPAVRALPGGAISVLGPVAIALTAMLFAVPEAREDVIDRRWQTRHYSRQLNRQRAVQRTDSVRAAQRDSVDRTPPAR
jgi:MFS family permease